MPAYQSACCTSEPYTKNVSVISQLSWGKGFKKHRYTHSTWTVRLCTCGIKISQAVIRGENAWKGPLRRWKWILKDWEILTWVTSWKSHQVWDETRFSWCLWSAEPVSHLPLVPKRLMKILIRWSTVSLLPSGCDWSLASPSKRKEALKLQFFLKFATEMLGVIFRCSG